MALGCDMPFRVGSEVNLRFYRPFWNSDFLLNATVRQAKKYGELNYIGVEFNRSSAGGGTALLSPFDHQTRIKKAGMA
jgi:hypothetical protein